MPEGPRAALRKPEDVDFRGDFKPELVQLLMRLRGDADRARRERRPVLRR